MNQKTKTETQTPEQQVADLRARLDAAVSDLGRAREDNSRLHAQLDAAVSHLGKAWEEGVRAALHVETADMLENPYKVED